MPHRVLPRNAFEDDEIDEIFPAKPSEKASSIRDASEMDSDSRYVMLLQENMHLKEEKKRLEDEKFQLVLDCCDKVKCDFQQFVGDIHPLRDCHSGPDVGEPLMPYEIEAFKRNPVKFADLNPELREPLVRETKWRIEDSKLRRHALKFLRDKREDRYMGPEFEPEARRVAMEMAIASFEAHKDFLPMRDEPEPLPNTPVIASCTLPLESGEAHFTITLTDDIEAVERGFEVVTIERELIDVVTEEGGEYGEGFDEKYEDTALFEHQQDSSRRRVQTDHFSLGAQTETLSRDQEFGLVGNSSKMRRPRAQTDGSFRSAMMPKGVRDRPAKTSDESTEGFSSSRDSSSKIGRGGARGKKTERGGSRERGSSRGKVRGLPRARGSSRRGAAQRKNAQNDGFNLYDYISRSEEEHDQLATPKRPRSGTSTAFSLPDVSYPPADALFGNPQISVHYASTSRPSTMYKSLQSLSTQIKPSFRGSEGSTNVGLMNQITGSQQREEPTSETVGDPKGEADGK